MFGKPSLKGDVTSPDNLFKFQAMVMRELAEQEPCVFVGRAAGYVLDQDEEIEIWSASLSMPTVCAACSALWK